MYTFCAAASNSLEPLSFLRVSSSPGQRAASGGDTEPSRQTGFLQQGHSSKGQDPRSAPSAAS